MRVYRTGFNSNSMMKEESVDSIASQVPNSHVNDLT